MNTVNPEVRTLVEWLNLNGFRTTDSGDGRNYSAGMEGAVPFPMVAIGVESEALTAEADRLAELMSNVFGLIFSERPGAPNIEASYNPGDGCAVVVLTNVTDSQLQSVISNKRLREALEPFTKLGCPRGEPHVLPAYHDLEDDVVVYENSGQCITAGDVRRACDELAQCTNANETSEAE